MSTIAMELAPSRSDAAARVAFHVACAVAGSLLVAALAQISFTLPFTPVPITGQTLGVLLVGAAYGPGLGATTLGLYLVWAVVGLPVLAPEADGSHRSGIEVLQLASATGGYLWGFVVAAAITGWLATRGWDRSMRSSISAMLLGSIVIYAFGVPWLMAALDVPLQQGLEFGLYPFVIGDTLKLLAAAGLLPVAWTAIRRLRPGGED
ncbi:MAG: biotin transporter BioY [Actinomycetota bacterium]|nr:biotin transporter BioY [Actinomycetota bacterium]MDH5223405.1 biotin transporter BioY [Actinomycetota bacterium]MDH5312281.1 biotin transporter BioY [Actinomycetota bacterium]